MKFSVYIDLFHHYTLTVFIGEKELPKYKELTDFEESDVVSMENVKGLMCENYMWLRTKDLTVFVHELHHVVSYLVETLDIHDEETEAYITAYLFKKCVKEMERA